MSTFSNQQQTLGYGNEGRYETLNKDVASQIYSKEASFPSTSNTYTSTTVEKPMLLETVVQQQPVLSSTTTFQQSSLQQSALMPQTGVINLKPICIEQEPVLYRPQQMVVPQPPLIIQPEAIMIPQPPIVIHPEPIIIPQPPLSLAPGPISVPRPPVVVQPEAVTINRPSFSIQPQILYDLTGCRVDAANMKGHVHVRLSASQGLQQAGLQGVPLNQVGGVPLQQQQFLQQQPLLQQQQGFSQGYPSQQSFGATTVPLSPAAQQAQLQNARVLSNQSNLQPLNYSGSNI